METGNLEKKFLEIEIDHEDDFDCDIYKIKPDAKIYKPLSKSCYCGNKE